MLRRIVAAPNDKTDSSKNTTPPVSAKADKQKGGRRNNELIVRFREDVSEQEKNSIVSARGGHGKKSLRGLSRIEKLELVAGQEPEAVAAELRMLPSVEFAEPNYLVSHDEVTPNDPSFNQQWALKNTGALGGQPGADIQAAPAWETTTGAPSTIIAVIDSGIDFTHPDLRKNQWTNANERANGRDDDHDGFIDDLYGWDWVANNKVIRDEQGHGTMVAGIIAAEGNNVIGTTGVMWRASLMSLRVLDNTGTGDVASAVEAIDYAVNHGAQVINCSWGTDEESIALKDAIARANNSGVVVVSSAGNSGRDIESTPYYPASYGLPNQIAVASTDNFDHLASWSNFGSAHITIAAPGTDILTTRMGGGYTTVTGTSASTPLVTGVAGLIKTQRWWLSAAGTRAAIVDGVRQVAELTGKVSSGGVVSAGGALNALQGPNTPPPGSGNSNNGNGNNGNGGGNGNGNNGNGNNPPVRPPAPGHGSGGRGPGGSFSTTTPAVTKGIPGSLPPNLAELRKQQFAAPKAPAPIHADLCPDCDPGGGTPQPAAGSDPYFATARVRPQNEVGEKHIDLGSRNFNWGIPLVSLSGRAGMDLDLGIVYNSLVWTKQGNAIMYNADRGFPSPGFRLGVPVLEARYANGDDLATSYIMVMPSGERVDLPQVGTSNVYESTDSSYIRLVDNNLAYASGNGVAFTRDGMQYFFTYPPGASIYRCTQIKDRNGNYLTINYNANAQISSIVDTLGRIITFNYVNDYLDSITQTWNGQTHVWATFGYGNLYFSTNFPGMSYMGPQGYITVLTQVGLADGTRYNFGYTSFGQVYKISHYAADQHLLNYTGYNLSGSEWQPSITAQSDCPRFTEQHDWAENWNNNQEAITYYSVDPNSAGGNQPAWSQVTTPDGTVYKELFSTANDWTKGLTTGSEVWLGDPNYGGIKQKWTTTAWTQDDPSLTYKKNPRPYDMSVYDMAGNRRRTDIIYHASYGLPYVKREYASDGTTLMRLTWTDYNLGQAYIDKHIIGLVSAIHVTDGNYNYVSKTSFDYDWGGEYLAGTPQAAIQHDETYYNAGFVSGRGNLSAVWSWDVTDINNSSKAIRQQNIAYNTDGSAIFTRDALNHQTSVSYTDSFSDSVNRNTFAYPTIATDADGYSSTMQYNYDFGAITRTQTPPPAGQTEGPVQTTEYDAAGRLFRVSNLSNGSWKYWAYPTQSNSVQSVTSVNTSNPSYYQITVFDGAGRVRAQGGDNPNSSGLYWGQFTLYDVMGRAVQVSNPEEMTSGWSPAGEDGAGWVWTNQAYDWKGRPTVTTNPDGTTHEMSYNVCGCAGSEVVTAIDERGRRRQMTMDVVGRLKQVDELNWDQSVYSTTTYTYNTRDQITSMNQAGQVRSFEYDGYGRQWRRTTPEQGQTTYSYFADGTAQTITDARGATATFGYNNRHLPTSITYGVPAGVTATPNVSFAYDAAGNRTSMTDGQGSTTYHYNQLSQMDWETRYFNGLNGSPYMPSGSVTLSYQYNLSGELKQMYNSWNGVTVGYSYDAMGRVTAVTGSGYAGVSSYVNSLSYRAFGGVKQINYGNSKQLSVQYDNRLRMTNWDVSGVMGWSYAYDTPSIHENTGRVAFANNLYDHTLDRSYDYDQVGRLIASHTGAEGRGHAGYAAWGSPDGPYAENYSYDQLGNMTWRNGWGAGNTQFYYSPQFVNNKMTVSPRTGAAVQYDASGNLISDGEQSFTYDATGQQAYASSTGLTQNYDGDGKRVKKIDNGVAVYYLRSSVLGGQVICEINQSGGWERGYVYLGGQMIALQDGGVYWVHQDPVTKSQRLTNSAGTISSWVDLDPWGAETGRSSNQTLQPHRFTSYVRDGNGSDDAMMRRYEGKWRMFAQPDPYDGSYSLTDPQSFNRYSYTQNDPVNFVDPSGLDDDVIVINHREPYWNAANDFADFFLESWSRFLDSLGRNGGEGVGHEFGHISQNPVPTQTQQQDNKPKCKQSPNGGDVPEILKYITAYGLMGLVDKQTIRHSVNPKTGGVGEGIQFQLYNRADAVASLASSPHFANAHLGFEHNGQVGGKNSDFRGLIGGDPNKGSGANKSLQFVIGPAGTVPGAPERALGYADLDCDNPGQGPGSLIRHIFK